jgi:hypothetical protein
MLSDVHGELVPPGSIEVSAETIELLPSGVVVRQLDKLVSSVVYYMCKLQIAALRTRLGGGARCLTVDAVEKDGDRRGAHMEFGDSSSPVFSCCSIEVTVTATISWRGFKTWASVKSPWTPALSTGT